MRPWKKWKVPLASVSSWSIRDRLTLESLLILNEGCPLFSGAFWTKYRRFSVHDVRDLRHFVFTTLSDHEPNKKVLLHHSEVRQLVSKRSGRIRRHTGLHRE